ncbi:MAG: DUF342 domain-containing protein [Agathobacter sp.]|nr:DUF342 domain-containing protein [Agathobacter sp.]
MEVVLKREPKIRISYDEMEAYLLLPAPLTPDEEYEFSDIMDKVRAAGVKIGLNETKISAMVEERYFDRECLIAKGIDAVNGVDAYFDFNFDYNFNKVPSRREDGTVDYWSIHTVELVEEGQVIATYHDPVDGSNGMTVKGKLLVAKRGRPLPPLTGKGFERSADNKTYTSTMNGKIEMKNNRILISDVHEVHGDVGLKTGNIDFRGDVIIHGNVPTGAVIRATGSITIDGTVEGALLDANKDIIIRGGMLGAGRGTVITKGNLIAKFLEYTKVKAHGSVTTDSLINCNITAYDKVFLKGKHASIVGGVVHAATGVEAFNFGNEYGVKTEIYVGVNMEVKKQITYHENCIIEAQDMIEKIGIGIKQLDDAVKAGADIPPNDPRRASLLRTKIVKQAELASHTQQLNEMNAVVESAHGASINVIQDVYTGVIIGINDALHQVKEQQTSVSFFERDGRVVMFSMKDELV